MEVFHWKEYWQRLRASLHHTYPQLSEQDLDYHEGAESQLMNRLSFKLRKSAAQVNELLFLHLITLEDEAELTPEKGMDPDTLLEELEKQMNESCRSSDRRRSE